MNRTAILLLVAFAVFAAGGAVLVLRGRGDSAGSGHAAPSGVATRTESAPAVAPAGPSASAVSAAPAGSHPTSARPAVSAAPPAAGPPASPSAAGAKAHPAATASSAAGPNAPPPVPGPAVSKPAPAASAASTASSASSASAPVATGMAVAEAVLCRSVDRERRKPIDVTESFRVVERRMWCFARVTGGAGHRVRAVWKLGGQTFNGVWLDAGGKDAASWPTWWNKTLKPSLAGPGTVDIMDDGGNVLATLAIRVEK